MSDDFIVSLPIRPLVKGSIYQKGERLPLHCTLMHWFKLSPALTLFALQDELQILARNTKSPLYLASEAGALFGPDEDVPVHTLRRSTDILMLHSRVFQFLYRHQCRFSEPRWVGDGYRPHVTTIGDESLLPGRSHDATKLALIERNEEGERRVQCIFELGFHL